VYYGYDTIRTPSLPNPDNVRVDERINTQTQFDWDITPPQRLTAILTLDPQHTDYANINTFNPQPVTADYRQRGFSHLSHIAGFCQKAGSFSLSSPSSASTLAYFPLIPIPAS
jgi:hypothetical protein